MKRKDNIILDEGTRVDLKFNNLWAIIASVVISAFIFGTSYAIMVTKLDLLLLSQNELKMDFKEWKKQWEVRLGMAELAIKELQTMQGMKVR